jgi:hypothetical protein
MPDIGTDKVCFIVACSREFEAQEGVVEEDYGGNQADEGFREILAAHGDDATYDEAKQFIDDLNIDEQCQMVALAWVGRGDFTAKEWPEVVKLATQQHNDRTGEYLLGMPLLSDYLEEALSQFNLSCDG